MTALYPFVFKLEGMTQDYLWGGDRLRPLVPTHPADRPLAEIWAIGDRPEDERVSVIANGPLAGTTLRQLMEGRSSELLGQATPIDGKFPLLVKLLDAKERLSLQVHPPASVAVDLGGEPKTECWTLLEGTTASAQLIAGVKPGTDRTAFETAIRQSDLEPLLHSIPVQAGDFMHLPSGRLHAIDAGCLLLEIQQNSNTTYRVYDWGRIDAKTGQSRELHIQKALVSIDLTDVAPSLTTPQKESVGDNARETLVDCPHFTLERWTIKHTQRHEPVDSFEIITTLDDGLTLSSGNHTLQLDRLGFVLVPAAVDDYTLSGSGRYIRTFVRVP